MAVPISICKHGLEITKGHRYKIYNEDSGLESRKKSFPFRVADTKSNLPAEVVKVMNLFTVA